MASQLKTFNGATLAKAPLRMAAPKRSVSAQGFIGSPNNIIMVVSTATFLAAGRFGLAPTVNRSTSAGLKFQEVDAGLASGDPAGFTIVDVLALGSFGHAVGAGIILGLHNQGII
eukprot:GFKZ01000342.1.p1 GENE.GFKZ01000342.1~~GFKZ01000342.1.p1  ORF type:complete len:115 (-),score=8.18 GFKZ01000342.1:537-881(-)